MEKDVKSVANAVLQNESALQEFSKENDIPMDLARVLLEKLLESPEISQASKEYVESKERSDDFQAYKAGEDVGFQRGKQVGIGQGAVLTLAALGIGFIIKKKYLDA